MILYIYIYIKMPFPPKQYNKKVNFWQLMTNINIVMNKNLFIS